LELPKADFESAASANSATPAFGARSLAGRLRERQRRQAARFGPVGTEPQGKTTRSRGSIRTSATLLDVSDEQEPTIHRERPQHVLRSQRLGLNLQGGDCTRDGAFIADFGPGSQRAAQVRSLCSCIPEQQPRFRVPGSEPGAFLGAAEPQSGIAPAQSLIGTEPEIRTQTILLGLTLANRNCSRDAALGGHRSLRVEQIVLRPSARSQQREIPWELDQPHSICRSRSAGSISSDSSKAATCR
jgi:hypothetical protein